MNQTEIPSRTIRTPVPKSIRRQKEAEVWSDMSPFYLDYAQTVRRTRTKDVKTQ